ncbi:MAG: MFS transporter [Candidatus Abyssobacteria bacterium SURF_5]|uniref:MFS transporter n=1 Tax=Abyssobacteria bacterium (strain SURF_5) TaxID=2093360 RepID=A0A3A4NII6_ABYX5|nr:MAG: MFS transporter [Candidatus Abyssubacteria bacterium SURF_5]
MELESKGLEQISAPRAVTQSTSIFEKTAYGIAGFGGGITRNMLSLYLLFYYADVVGLNPAYVSAAIMIGNIWDAVTDPLMGFVSDHTHTRFGRRRIYLLAGALPLGILIFALWAPPARLIGFPLFIYVTVLVVLLYALYTVVAVPYLALGAELSPDSDERSSIFGFNFAFTRFGELAGAIVPHVALEFSDDVLIFLHQDIGILPDAFFTRALEYFSQPTNAFRFSAGLAGFIITCTTLATFFGTHERVAHEPERKLASSRQIMRTMYGDLFSTLKNRPFFILLISMMTIDVGSGITASMMMYITKYWLKMEELVSVFFATYMFFAMLSAVFWVQFSKRTSKKLAYLLGQSILTIALFASFFMEEGKTLRVFALLAFGGFGLGAYVMLWSLIADLVDFDEYETHKRREGAYYGIYTLFSKAAGGIGVFLTGVYLNFIGFEKGVEIDPEILLKIKLLYAPFTALINLAGVIIFSFFSYDKQEHARIQMELAERKGRVAESEQE